MEREIEKIPIDILYKESRKEVGQLTSYIQELEHELRKWREVSKEERLQIKTSEIYKERQQIINRLNIEIKLLRQDNLKYITKITTLTNK